jgi:hypothetical protein
MNLNVCAAECERAAECPEVDGAAQPVCLDGGCVLSCGNAVSNCPQGMLCINLGGGGGGQNRSFCMWP